MDRRQDLRMISALELTIIDKSITVLYAINAG
jgi:hypothetical protein